ncbi:5' nucleotidase, deoxy (Pyrimidine), cytosolic type C protein (NT5C), partial [Bordetella pertussis STO1-CNMC-0004]
ARCTHLQTQPGRIQPIDSSHLGAAARHGTIRPPSHHLRRDSMLILLDQDGVLADFEHAFIDAWRKRHPDIEPVAFEERKSFHIREDYAPELRGLAEAIYTAPGFIRDLPPVPGAVEAFRELLALGMDVRICSSPLMQFENCVAEKYLWVERHLGRDATQRLILTRDKTLVQGDLLIDDRPVITGAARPRWRHIIYDAPYNRDQTDRPRLDWRNWRNVLAGELYRSDA